MILPGQEITPEILKRFKSVVNAEENPVKYLGIDPGKSNGVCGYDERYRLMFMYNIPQEHMIDFIESFDKVTHVVIESFRLYPGRTMTAQTYSDMETSRVIGRVESWAKLHGVKFISQGANIKNTAYKWLGKKPLPKSDPNNHSLDAHIHFMYWAIKNGKVKIENVA